MNNNVTNKYCIRIGGKMKNLIKYFTACVIALLFVTSLTKISADAATTKMYTINTDNTQVYSDTDLTQKYSIVSDRTELTLLQIDEKYCKISWSSGSRTKTGYVPKNIVLLNNKITLYTSIHKIKTYNRPNGMEYGYISKGDEVAIIGTKGAAVQVRYPVSFGYKVAFVSLPNSVKYITQTAETYYVTASPSLVMRKSASESGAKLTTVPKDSVVIVYKIADGWAYCTYGSKTGFLSERYLTKEKPKSIDLSYALYHSSKAYVSCGFDGYVNTSGRHEGIDITYKTGEPVYALASGVVTAAKKGKTGRNGLSTLAIYNEDDNKTVVYLHMTLGDISVGDKIQIGQKIGTQSWRGISSSNSAHTHVEVRNGKKTAAAKSVNDDKLDNSNPKDYWKSKGYTI